ncbi:MAG: DUF2617 family protein [Planctomycetes bacterium]|nr:DUF2617 family protein [Planctomycetota bacterium]
MQVRFARPDVSELTFHVFERSVHPELFRVYAQQQVRQGAYSAEICICEAGHTVAVQYAEQTVTEVAASSRQLLPQKKHTLNHKLHGQREKSICFRNGIKYQVGFHLEQLDFEVFLNLHQELQTDCSRVELSHQFPAGGRLALEPLSVVRVFASPSSLLIHAYHTFPEDNAVVKSQSLFELQGDRQKMDD